MSPKKCELFKKKVKYVGHIVSKDGIEPDLEKLEKVANWPRPEDPNEVSKFLGFEGYYRCFVKDFAKIAKPLNGLLPCPKLAKVKGKKVKQESSCEWKWEQEQEQAFVTLKQCLLQPPILG